MRDIDIYIVTTMVLGFCLTYVYKIFKYKHGEEITLLDLIVDPIVIGFTFPVIGPTGLFIFAFGAIIVGIDKLDDLIVIKGKK